MRRAITAVTGALCTAVLLTGCSPPDLRLAALWKGEDGRWWAELRPCGDDLLNSPHLSGWPTEETETAGSETAGSEAAGSGGSPSPEPEPEPTIDDSTGWRTWSMTPTGRVRFPLFEPPESWRAEATGPQELRPGYTYGLTFRVGADSSVYRGSVFASTEELATLRPGQVWADGRAMSMDEFDDVVADQC
ncbi:hypothetical protein [Streptomyces sp. NBC_00872]|uniref:hypothetical protein n=1 Tax=Streptomyces sp. NBC_00872 TaxID=2903686 RepID=UPI0038660086|nr:hypothetical protein OG214_11305 [Streptomyces sp. NBC_00872]